MTAPRANRICDQCGAPYYSQRASHYCTVACREAARTARRRQRDGCFTPRPCAWPGCSTMILPERGQKYCPECRPKAARKTALDHHRRNQAARNAANRERARRRWATDQGGLHAANKASNERRRKAHREEINARARARYAQRMADPAYREAQRKKRLATKQRDPGKWRKLDREYAQRKRLARDLDALNRLEPRDD